MNDIIRKIIEVEGDSTRQFVDLLLFLAYFGFCIYAGGASYETRYFSEFNLPASTDFKYYSLGVLFVSKVLFASWIWLPAVLYLITFVFLYYCARYLWRPWFGYFVISGIFFVNFLSCIALGNYYASSHAARDRIKNSSITPVIKIYKEPKLPNIYANGNYHLVHETDNFLYVYEPQSFAESVFQVHSINKKSIDRYEVTIK